jgi:hypothetical protein
MNDVPRWIYSSDGRQRAKHAACAGCIKQSVKRSFLTHFPVLIYYTIRVLSFNNFLLLKNEIYS